MMNIMIRKLDPPAAKQETKRKFLDKKWENWYAFCCENSRAISQEKGKYRKWFPLNTTFF
jgi:hypothetical protein